MSTNTSNKLTEYLTRNLSPDLRGYLTHPEIVIGLAKGRHNRASLLHRLQEMADADSGEGCE